MRLRQDIDLSEFFGALKKCKADVYFETPKGDSLILNSLLSQYFFRLFSQDSHVMEVGSIRTADPADQELISEYLTE